MNPYFDRNATLRNGFKRAAQLAVIGAASSFFVLGLGLARAASPTPAPDQPGQATFESNCTLCHGEDGSSDTPLGSSLGAPDLRSDDVQKLSDAELTDVITNGKDPMPSFKGKLTADEIKEVVGYIRTLAKKK